MRQEHQLQSRRNQPFLLQVDGFDAAEIEELRSAEDLAKGIAIRWPSEGMLA